MNNVVGKQVRVFGKHIGKVIAETFEDGTYCSNTYLVLLNSNGVNRYRGWNCYCSDIIRKKLCGKYGKNLNNFFYFFRKAKEKNRFEFFGKTMENE